MLISSPASPERAPTQITGTSLSSLEAASGLSLLAGCGGMLQQLERNNYASVIPSRP